MTITPAIQFSPSPFASTLWTSGSDSSAFSHDVPVRRVRYDATTHEVDLALGDYGARKLLRLRVTGLVGAGTPVSNIVTFVGPQRGR